MAGSPSSSQSITPTTAGYPVADPSGDAMREGIRRAAGPAAVDLRGARSSEEVMTYYRPLAEGRLAWRM